MDYDPLEIERKISISLSIGHFGWKEHFVNIIDTPGYADFRGEVISAVSVSDGAVIVVDSTSGVEVGTEWVWELTKKKDLPSLIFANALSKENADFFKVLGEITKEFRTGIVPLTIPIGKGEKVGGVVNLLTKKAFMYKDGKAEEVEIPSDIKEKVEGLSKNLVEGLVETDENLMERYLGDEKIKEEELASVLKKGVAKGEIHPVFCGDAYRNIGVDILSDSIVQLFSSPEERVEMKVMENDAERGLKIDEPFTALVFKSVFEPHLGELNYIRLFSGELSAGTEVFNTTKQVS